MDLVVLDPHIGGAALGEQRRDAGHLGNVVVRDDRAVDGDEIDPLVAGPDDLVAQDVDVVTLGDLDGVLTGVADDIVLDDDGLRQVLEVGAGHAELDAVRLGLSRDIEAADDDVLLAETVDRGVARLRRLDLRGARAIG